MAKILSTITAIASGIVSMLNVSPIKSSLPRSDATSGYNNTNFKS
jgi:hypothetical protein